MRRQRVQRPDRGQHPPLVFVEGHAFFELLQRLEGRPVPLLQQLADPGLRQPPDHTQPQADGARGINRALPLRLLHADRTDPQSAAAGIGQQRGGGVKAHGLVVEQAGEKLRRPMHFEPGAGVGQNRKADRVGLGKPVERKGPHRFADAFDGGGRHPFGLHPLAQFHGHFGHALRAAMETQGAAQFLRLAAREIAHHHRNSQELFLKKRHPQRAFEDRDQPRVVVGLGLLAGPPRQIGMHQVALDGARADDRHFDADIVKTPGLHPGQRGHLRPALDLEHTHRVRRAHQIERCGIVLGDLRQVHRGAPVRAQRHRVLKHRHHA